MGVELVTVAWTQTTEQVNEGRITALIRGIPNERLQENLAEIDWTGRLAMEDDATDSQDAETVRDWLLNGAKTYANIGSLRLHETFDFPGASLVFYIAGGGTWGDDPFDGWTDLATFLTACEVMPDLGVASNYVCGGLPNPQQITAHPEKE